MFVFYYALLSEVSPPTALSCFAAAAITGGNPYRTTLYAWKYTLPAFIVPFMFTVDPRGAGILLKGPLGPMAWTIITGFLGITAIAAAVENYFLRPTRIYERLTLLAAGLLMILNMPAADAVGIGLMATVALLQKMFPQSR
jgi:TRAP-type uncharacterized transport system fused permease subunit